MSKKNNGPKVLIIDIETAPIKAAVWALFDQNIGLNMIESDWHILAVSCKWLGEAPNKAFYMDQRNAKNVEDDRKILEAVWKLMDEADIVIGQNSKRFDVKKLNARFILNGMQPPSSFKQIDTLVVAKKHFAFTSNKLEYLSDKLCKKFKKKVKRKFSGYDLWRECLDGNMAAWKEMELYNRLDVLATEEVYNKLIPWDNGINFNLYTNDNSQNTCKCGSTDFMKKGFFFSPSGKFQRYRCKDCGNETRSKENLLSVEKRKSLRPGTR